MLLIIIRYYVLIYIFDDNNNIIEMDSLRSSLPADRTFQNFLLVLRNKIFYVMQIELYFYV